MARPRRNKAAPRWGMHPSPALRVTSLVALRFCRALGEDSHSRSKAPRIRTTWRIPETGRAAPRQRRSWAGNKRWGVLFPLAAGRPSRPSSGSRTPACGRASLTTQSRGSGGPFYPRGGWQTRARGRREEGPEPRRSQPDPRLRKAIKLARARTPTSTCARRVCRAFGDGEKLAVLSLPSSHRCRRPLALCWSHPRPRPAASR